jgi:hypothetical protein
MKKLTGVLLGLALTSLITATTARGQTNRFNWRLDETGPALLSGPIVGYSNGSHQVDPISGILGWYYPLGGPFYQPGDVLMLEPGTSEVSDLLRFDGSGVFFFSELEPGELNAEPADVPMIPPAINPVFLYETGPEGNNGAYYLPDVGQPGFGDPEMFPGGMSYTIVSDIPEPTTFALAGLAAAALMISRRRK